MISTTSLSELIPLCSVSPKQPEKAALNINKTRSTARDELLPNITIAILSYFSTHRSFANKSIN